MIWLRLSQCNTFWIHSAFQQKHESFIISLWNLQVMYAPSKPGDQPSVEVKNLIEIELKIEFCNKSLFWRLNKWYIMWYCFFPIYPPELICNFFAFSGAFPGWTLSFVSSNSWWQDEIKSKKYLRSVFSGVKRVHDVSEQAAFRVLSWQGAVLPRGDNFSQCPHPGKSYHHITTNGKQNYAGDGIWEILFWRTESLVHPKIKDGACFYMEMSLQLPAACTFKLIITIAKRIACTSGFLHKCQSAR